MIAWIINKLSRLLEKVTTPSPRGGIGVGVALLLLLYSCSVELPPHVIGEGRMERILYDYHLAQGMAEAQGGDVEANRYLYVQKVFEKHHITEAQFDTSMVWYSGHASHLDDMYRRIDARLERESREAGLNIPEEDKFARFTTEGDTANIWQGHDIMFLHGNREQNLYSLVIPADTSYRDGDYFMFRCGNRFIVQDGQREGYVLMQVRYDNDSTVANAMMVSGDYDATVNIPADRVLRNQRVKSITCTFYYAFDENRDEAFRMWVIRKPVLLRYHRLEGDTATAVVDTLAMDSTQHPVQVRGERVSPLEFRENQQVEKKIEVIQRREVVMPAGGPQRRVVKPRR